MPAVADEDLVADVDEPPDHRVSAEQRQASFHKSTIPPPTKQKESLLTRALLTSPESEASKPEIHVTTDSSRRRSMISNASLASTAELTSDGGLTSPARTNTPSPPIPNAAYTSFAPYSLAAKSIHPPEPLIAKVESKEPAQISDIISVSPKAVAPVDPPQRRCIKFVCDGKKGMNPKPVAALAPPPPVQLPTATTDAPKRACVKFSCGQPKPSDKNKPAPAKIERPSTPQSLKPAEWRNTNRSSSITRKSPRPGATSSTRTHRDSTSTIRRSSQSPVAVRAKPKYIIADEKTLQSSEATRFHEFASEELHEDDWIRKGSEIPRERLTINDTLKMENAIRQLGNEAEEEALEDEDAEEDREGNDSDDENDFDDDDEEDQDEDPSGSDDDHGSDGNETDNEAGFAESDDESDGEGEYAFWTPGRDIPNRQAGEVNTYRASAHRTASASSIDSLNHMSPPEQTKDGRKSRRRPIKIRPGTPELPDSTDFVCGTLDEDRPLEDAYVSCMEARKYAKHKQTPQDIDPSFPTSDPENEEDENDAIEPANDSDEQIWLHGKFEEDEETHGRRRSTIAHRRSPNISPKRLHSPPPPRRLHSPPPAAKHRLRSPPPRKLFGGHSPKRMRSPPPARTIRSPPASPTTNMTTGAITFAPLASRPGLTHTKSLPRTPNPFCRQYRASRIAALNGNESNDQADGHLRGAIDIKKGLENKRQRRKEKHAFKGKDKIERRPLPGKGAERMRELGLLMAGKGGPNDPYMLSA